MTNWLLLAGVLAIFGILAVQHQSTRRLAADVAALRQELAVAEPTKPEMESRRERTSPLQLIRVSWRLTALEETVAQLVRNSEYLMERGQLPVEHKQGR